MMNRSTLTLALLLAAASPASASPPDPAAIGKQIDVALAHLADQLGAISDGRVDGATDGAEATAKQLDELYDDLIATDAADAIKRGKAGHAVLKELDTALLAVGMLKHVQDEPRALVDECKKVGKQLTDAADKFAKAKDVTGVVALPELGDKLGKPIGVKLEKLTKARGILDNQVRVATRLDRAGDWSKVSSALAEVAQHSYDDFVDGSAEAKRECGSLAQGAEHPRILLVVKELKDVQGQRLDSLEGLLEEYERYQLAVRGLRKIYDDDVDDVMKAMCELEEDGRGDLEAPALKSVLDRIKRELEQNLQSIKREDVALDAGIAKLAASLNGDPAKSKQLAKIKAAVASTRRSLANAVKISVLAQGSNNPWIRSRIELGKRMHKEYQSSGRCDFKEVRLPSGQFVDCIEACQLVEIKPDTDKARRRGEVQVRGYYKEVADAWSTLKDEAAFTAKFPAMKQCFVKGELKLISPRVVTYKICPSSPNQLELGAPFYVDPAKL